MNDIFPAYDPATNRILLFGGLPNGTTPVNDTWAIANANGLTGSPTWQQLSAANPPGPRFGGTGFLDALHDRLFFFGGNSNPFGGAPFDNNELWMLTGGLAASPSWQQIVISGPSIPPIVVAGAVYDTTSNRMILFGGSSYGVTSNDTWVLTDANGITAVSYRIYALYDQTKAVKSGSTIPIKFQLYDASDLNVSASSITVHAVSVTQVSTNAPGTLEDSGNANPDLDFRYDSTLGGTGGYIFNLSTKGDSTGTYQINFTAGADPTPHYLLFQVK